MRRSPIWRGNARTCAADDSHHALCSETLYREAVVRGYRLLAPKAEYRQLSSIRSSTKHVGIVFHGWSFSQTAALAHAMMKVLVVGVWLPSPMKGSSSLCTDPSSCVRIILLVAVDDARETLTTAGLEKAKERSLEQHLRLRAPQTWAAHANGNWCRDVNVCLLWQSWTRESEVSIVARDISERCADNVRNLLPSQVPRAVARVLAKAAGAVETRTSAIVVDRSVIADLIALVETRVESCSLWQVWTFESCVSIFWWERKFSGCRGGTR